MSTLLIVFCKSQLRLCQLWCLRLPIKQVFYSTLMSWRRKLWGFGYSDVFPEGLCVYGLRWFQPDSVSWKGGEVSGHRLVWSDFPGHLRSHHERLDDQPSHRNVQVSRSSSRLIRYSSTQPHSNCYYQSCSIQLGGCWATACALMHLIYTGHGLELSNTDLNPIWRVQ